MKMTYRINPIKKWMHFVINLMLFFFLIIPQFYAYADIGPNPTMEFEFDYEITPVTIDNAKLIFCEDMDCESSQKVMGPFRCDQDSCSYSYGGNTYYKLVITYSDKTRESNVFQKTRFSSSFTVIVNQDELQVSENSRGKPYERRGQIGGFLLALAITIPIELLVGLIFTKKVEQPLKIIVITAANLISLPILWFGFPFIRLMPYIVLLLGEIFVLLFETWFIQINFETMSYAIAFWLSLSMNLASFIFSFLLLLIGEIPAFPMII